MSSAFALAGVGWGQEKFLSASFIGEPSGYAVFLCCCSQTATQSLGAQPHPSSSLCLCPSTTHSPKFHLSYSSSKAQFSPGRDSPNTMSDFSGPTAALWTPSKPRTARLFLLQWLDRP